MNKQLTIDFIRSEFEKEGYQLLSTEYKNKQKLDYVCKNGHQQSIRWHDWRRGRRCRLCYDAVIGNRDRHSLDFIKFEFEKEGYRLLTTEYKGNKQKLNYVCSAGHRHHIRWNDWQQGHRCQICAIINRIGQCNHNWRGGISYEPYCSVWSDKEYKSDIRERDGNQCLNPYCFHSDGVLNIHHIDYNKKNCAPQNLITICRSCNARANFDRKWHTEFYRTILNKRYGYEYKENLLDE